MNTLSQFGVRLTLLAALLATVTSALTPSATQAQHINPAGSDLTVTWGPADVALTLALPAYSVESVELDGVAYQRIVVDNGAWSTSGRSSTPELPERGVPLAVPPTGETTVEMLPVRSQVIATRVILAPAPHVRLGTRL